MPETAMTSASKTTIELFLLRFAESLHSAYLRLLYYAAMPLVVTPELLHYLRNAFVREAPWVAEADLLLAEAIFEEKNFEQYVMQLEVRQYLLGNASQFLGEKNMQQAAHLLVRYISQQLSQATMTLEEIQSQQWAALLYLEEHYDQVISEIVKAMQASFQASEVADLSGRANYESMLELVRQLAPALDKTPELVTNARIWQGILHQEIDPTTLPPGQLTQEVEVAGIKLPSFAHLLPPVRGKAEAILSDLNPDDSLTTIVTGKAEDGEQSQIYAALLPTTATLLDQSNLRRTPGYVQKPTNDLLAQLLPGEEVTVVAGPQIQDQVRWWQVVTKGGMTGWAAEKPPSSSSLLLQFTGLFSWPQANKDLSHALNYFNQVLAHFRVVGDKSGEAITLTNAGSVFAKLSRFDEALKYYDQAVQLFGDLHDIRGGAITLVLEAEAWAALVEWKSARDRYERALDNFNRIYDYTEAANCSLKIGEIDLRLKKYDSAQYFFEESCELYERTDNVAGQATAFQHLGALNVDLQEYERAKQYFQQALTMFEQIGDLWRVATCRQRLGDIDRLTNRIDIDQALQNYEQALALFRQLGDKLGEASTLNSLGLLFTKRSDRPETLAIFEQALTIYHALGDKDGESAVQQNIELLLNERTKNLESLNVGVVSKGGGQWGPELITLRNQLARLYPTRADALRLVSAAQLNPTRIAFDGSALNTWHNILNEARRYNKVAALLEVAVAEYPNNPELLAAYEAYIQSQPAPTIRPIKILFLSANPLDSTRLKLAEEVRAIDHVLRRAAYRDHFDLNQQGVMRSVDLQELLLRYQPDIVHFSGHRLESDEILVLDDKGESHAISGRALGALFAVLKDDIRCVVLNACYSQPQAEAIAQHIDFVIGMSSAIPEQASYQFAAAFYQGLADGRAVKTAFDLGCLQIELNNALSEAEPKLFALHSDPAQVRFVSEAMNKPVTPATQESRSNIHINTGGGAYIAGSVDTSGGDFVGRKKRSK